MTEQFRVYPLGEETAPFFVVSVSDTLAEMRALLDEHEFPATRTVLASCISATRPYDDDHIGWVFFAREALGSGMVAHEMAHAAFRMADACGVRVEHWRRPKFDGVDMSNGREEVYASVIENLTRQFWREAYERGIAV